FPKLGMSYDSRARTEARLAFRRRHGACFGGYHHADLGRLPPDLPGAPSRTPLRPAHGGPLPRERRARRDRPPHEKDRRAGHGPALLGASRTSTDLPPGVPDDGRGRARTGGSPHHLPPRERTARGNRLGAGWRLRSGSIPTRPGPPP